MKTQAPHGEADIKNSWYWSVLIKNYGSERKAKQAIIKSKQMVDPTYIRFAKRYDFDSF